MPQNDWISSPSPLDLAGSQIVTRRSGESPYPRLGYPFDDSAVLDSASAGDAGAKAAAYDGYRFLTQGQIQSLATQIVLQVRRRGPFISLADFVNRSLSVGSVSGADNRLMGALAQAIADAGINAVFSSGQQAALPDKGGSGCTAMVETAAAEGIPTAELAQRNSDVFQRLQEKLNISFDRFIRTTDADHLRG